MTTIDRDAAHDAAQNELSKPIYPRASVTDQLTDWLDHLLYRLASHSASVPGGWLTLTVLALLIIAAVIVAVRIARRTMRGSRDTDYSLFGTTELSAAQHRATAEQCAAHGDWSAAIRHRVRAVARQLEEGAILTPNAGRTATELARDAGAAIPELSDELASAAATFNDVSYGEQSGDEPGYRAVAELDRRLTDRSAYAR